MDAFRYRYQLEAFVDRVRGRTPQHWYDALDSVADMVWIEKVYEKVTLLSSTLDSHNTDIAIQDGVGESSSVHG